MCGIGDDISARAARRDVLLLEAVFYATAKLTTDRELLAGHGLHQHQVVDFSAAYALDPGYLRLGDDPVSELRLVAKLVPDLLEQLHHVIAIFLIVDRDMHGQLG